MKRLALEYAPQGGWVGLRGLSGSDEESVDGSDTPAALALLDRLLVGAPEAAALPAPDRDRLLASVLRADFGGRVESTLHCAGCDEPYDLAFTLDAIEEHVDAEAAAAGCVREDGGIFRMPDGRRFRLPTGADELALAALPPAEVDAALVDRCLVGGPAADPAPVLEAMRAVGPIL